MESNVKSNVKRIFVEKRKGYDVEAQALYKELKCNLGIMGLTNIRIVNRYDFEGVSQEDYNSSRNIIFSEPPVDIVYDEILPVGENERVFVMEYLPGQFDQRADSIAQGIQLLTRGEKPTCRAAKVILLDGDISDDEFGMVKNHCINSVETRETSLDKPHTLETITDTPEDIKIINGFTHMNSDERLSLLEDMGLAMSPEDLTCCWDYFKNIEKRDPTVTEIKAIDIYWSDHCRHTTFFTEIENIEINDSANNTFLKPIKSALDNYRNSREFVYGSKENGNVKKAKPVSLMDVATLAMKELKKKGLLKDLDESDEINACSIIVNADVNGRNEEWLVMFKNETHNHPTEIEPFGGASTCLGGAIRDPLSGRSYVYQAMRVTGSGDPCTPIENTIPGKLPQSKITTTAAAGYSSYGNQIGVAGGQVVEIYHEGYVAKRMELGAVIAAAPRSNVVREKPMPDDVVILLGGRTGRDGCGGATGSSKEHSEESLATSGAEVQKGNPPLERRIQRLFRNPSVSTLIKKCNDFGAGGVMVAIGELADGLDINLDAVPKKYEGLDGTELSISESQERMAVVVSPEDISKFIEAASEENLEATPVAVVTEVPELKIRWRGKVIVNIKREFLNSNGAQRKISATISLPDDKKNFFNVLPNEEIESAWLANLKRLNVCSQKGLVERFDSTVGASTVLMPLGGKYQLTPSEGMVAKIPVLDGDTSTGTMMSFGYNPELSEWSPFHGAVFAIVEAVAKIVALGGDYKKIRLSLQEYFEKLGEASEKWGKPLSALLGAHYIQTKLGLPAIGGKDSMSGTFKDMSREINVPPTLVAFAVNTVDVNYVVSSEFKKAGSNVILIPLNRDENEMPDLEQLMYNYEKIHQLIKNKKILASFTVKTGGIAEAISKMCFGNMLGFTFDNTQDFIENNNTKKLFSPDYGSIILEIDGNENLQELLSGVEHIILGHTQQKPEICINNTTIDLEKALQVWREPLEKVFSTKSIISHEFINSSESISNADITKSVKAMQLPKVNKLVSIARPRVFIPVFPGANSEYDIKKAFENAGGIVDTFVIRNLSSKDIEESFEIMIKKIENSQIIVIPSGLCGGDELDGSGKYVVTAFRNPFIKEAITHFLEEKDGLMLGISDGFNALIKLGLVPYGEIRDIDDQSPTLAPNSIGRHVSCMVNTKVVSNLSPWLSNTKIGDIYTIPVSSGQGRFVATKEDIAMLEKNGQIATKYVDLNGNPTYDIDFNPNGSYMAVEGITSPDGRVFGKMGHSERIGSNVAKNISGEKDQKLFEAGVRYFK